MEARFEVDDPAFRRLVPEDAAVALIAAGFAFTEGPVWNGDHLLFSDIPNNRIVRWRQLPEGPEVTTFRYPSGFPLGQPTKVEQMGSNGLTLDRRGRLLACEHGNRRVTRTEPDGSVIALADRYEGKRLNSPNDIVCRSDGRIYFTDPPYGLVDRTEGKELAFQGVFRIDPDGSLHLVADDFERPNGLAFAPDERTLYIDDSGRRHIRGFDVDDGGNLSHGRVFADLAHPDEGNPDGMKVDVEGNVYCAAAGGTWVLNSAGAVLGRIITPDRPANVGWGGSDWRTLFITARPSVYRLRVGVPGMPVQ
ncbi:MAG: SMP-30/gluconolactonase/LRE family protein [Chloroflexota bacterium]|nr:SMP-30/gluconolactonase/LRE family protein [Chloroflexota bacterium]